MKNSKYNQFRRTRREVWEVFSLENLPRDPKIYVECIVKKAQALFERYSTLYENLGVQHPASLQQFKIISIKTEKIYFALLEFRDSCKHEIAKLKKEYKETLKKVLQKLEDLASKTWKDWFSLSYKRECIIDSEFN